MSNKRENSPELDYYELRKRHEEYKSRAQVVQGADKLSSPAPQRDRPARPVAVPEAPANAANEPVFKPQPNDEAQPASKAAARDAQVPDEPRDEAFMPADEDELAELIDEDAGYAEDDADEDANPNPFDSFIRIFKGVKDNLAARKGAKGDANADIDLDELDDLEDLSDEELAALMDEDGVGEQKAAAKRPMRAYRSADASQAQDIDDLPSADMEIDGEFAEEMPGGAPDEDDYAEDEWDDVGKSGGLKRFLNLFVERVSDEEQEALEDDDEEFDDEEPDDEYLDDDLEAAAIVMPRSRANKDARRESRHTPEPIEDVSDNRTHTPVKPARASAKGGQIMDDFNKPLSNTEQTMDAGSEGGGMTRRERRELAMRLAAEEAARKAAEEADRAAAEQKLVETVDSNDGAENAPLSETSERFVFSKPDASDDVIVGAFSKETEAESAAEQVDEPTRIFAPVTSREARVAESSSLFEAKAKLHDEDDEEDEDEENEAPKFRRGLFGKKHPAKDEYDEDDDDEDEEDEDDDEEERKPRRGLFGKKRRIEDDEDDDDEDDEYDDEDDDEYDDEDDEYDDDEDDEYDDDEDEYDDEHHSFGYHLVHGLLWMFGILMVLAVAVIALNFLYSSGNETIVPKVRDLLGEDSTAFHLLFPVYEKEAEPEIDDDDILFVDPDIMFGEEGEIDPLPEIPAEPAVLPEVEEPISIPDLNADPAIEINPVVNSAPVVDPAAQPIIAGSIG